MLRAERRPLVALHNNDVGRRGIGMGGDNQIYLRLQMPKQKIKIVYLSRYVIQPTDWQKGCTCFFELGGDESRKGPT